MRRLLLVLFPCVLAALAVCIGEAEPVSGTNSERHLVAFTFINHLGLNTLTEKHVRWLNESVFTGAGVEYVGQYRCERGPTLEDLSESLAALNRQCTKHLWPTIFLNTMLGYDPDNTWHHPGAPPHAGRVPLSSSSNCLQVERVALLVDDAEPDTPTGPLA